MTIREDYDVVIAGGGLAGLCLALQLTQNRAGIRILVAERNRHPLPEAAHKVGESSVEVGSHYFCDVLGLSDLLEKELRKFGLRFFMSHDGNRDITSRLECGPSHFLYVPSYQIDRGRFENELAGKARRAGVDFADGCDVSDIDLGNQGADHRVAITRGAESFSTRCRWLVDASGRAALLKKKLGLARGNRHDVNAAWFRIDHPIDPDDWSDDLAWHARNKHSRRLSTNHLMGAGYWVWLIPLAGGRTSVGIVATELMHPFSKFRTFPAALAWLDTHEPQCAAVVRSHANERMDFLALKNYSHGVKQAFSGDRWCIVGDSGIFIDPLYSPGSDFIGIANGFSCDLIARDLDGEDIEELAATYDQTFRSLARTFLVTYQQQYSLMGSGRVMTTKVVWDFVMYWGGIALIYFREKFCDPAFLERVHPILRAFAHTNITMQAFFREWAAAEKGVSIAGRFVDYSEIGFLAEMNRNLQLECDDDALIEQLNRNLEFALELKQEIMDEAGSAPGTAATSHLAEMFAALDPAGPA